MYWKAGGLGEWFEERRREFFFLLLLFTSSRRHEKLIKGWEFREAVRGPNIGKTEWGKSVSSFLLFSFFSPGPSKSVRAEDEKQRNSSFSLKRKEQRGNERRIWDNEMKKRRRGIGED